MTEANLAGNVTEWIVDNKTRHICSNQNMFSTYDKTDGENVFMGNSSSASVQGKGKIILKLNSRKLITLTNVLHVSEMCRNLMFGSLLMKAGLKLSFESDRLVGMIDCLLRQGRGFYFVLLLRGVGFFFLV